MKLPNGDSSNLDRKELDRLNQGLGYNSKVLGSTETRTDLLSGALHMQRFPGGLSMHCARVRELKDASVFVELPAGLSFNIVFSGQVDFSVGGQRHQLGATGHPVECSTIVLERPEVMTRHLQHDACITKVNVFVERDWLQQRYNSPRAREQLQRWFQRHAAVHQWEASEKLANLASPLLDVASTQPNELELEAQTTALLAHCLDELSVMQPITAPAVAVDQPALTTLSLSEKIDRGLQQQRNLDEIATSFGMSISTLQRKFKAAYGMTVMEYIRGKRLDQAKAALIRDGVSIGEAAYLAGYNHTSNFITAFKRRFSMPPTLFRKNHRLPPS